MGAGVHFVAAAGNGNTDVSYSSPANLESVIAVGATAIDDSRARFSNYGEVLDISAPGVQVISTYIGSPNATASMNGTSMVSSGIALLDFGIDQRYFIRRPHTYLVRLHISLPSKAISLPRRCRKS